MEKLKYNTSQGWFNGFIGVVVFSGSLPATRIAVLELNPIFLTTARATIAGLLALVVLWLFKAKKPTKKQILPLAIIAAGVVIGFPLLSSLALQHITSAHSLVYVGLLPIATAIFGIVRGGEHPRPVFWLFSIMGSAFVVGYAAAQGLTTSLFGDLLMIAAIVLCALGYAEGAKLTKVLGGWQVISWALLLSLPVMIPAMFFYVPASYEGVSRNAWLSLGYVSVFSMFVGFVFWYRGLAQGGTATVGQLQLLQPFFGLTLAASLLNEKVSMSMLGVTLGVILCVAGTKKFVK